MQSYTDLLDLARKETGLNDFGDDSFREGLEILVGALRSEAGLNTSGDAYLQGRIVGHLKQRLQIEDWYRRHPDMQDVEIRAPLIGISLPRTGSTALSFLLARDPNARTLRTNEAATPCPPPALRDASPAVANDASQRRDSSARSHVPKEENGPAECQDLMALDFRSQIFLAFARVPSYARWLLDADLTSTYQYHRRALKLLQWRMPDRPWRLKCPTHLVYLEHLNKAYPDARFVMTHRDPTEVIRSVVAVYVDIASRFTEQVDVDYFRELNIEQWSVGMRRALAFRDAGNEQRFFDIHFRAMRDDPVGEVRGLYAWLGEPVSPEFVAGMENWWRANASARESAPEAGATDYGIDPAAIRPLFADYIQRMPGYPGQSNHLTG